MEFVAKEGTASVSAEDINKIAGFIMRKHTKLLINLSQVPIAGLLK